MSMDAKNHVRFCTNCAWFVKLPAPRPALCCPPAPKWLRSLDKRGEQELTAHDPRAPHSELHPHEYEWQAEGCECYKPREQG